MTETALEHFIGAYLHQDFDVDGDEWGALQTFLGDEGTARARELADDIDRVLARFADENGVREALLGMGLGFSPEVDGETCRGWLVRVRERVLAGL